MARINSTIAGGACFAAGLLAGSSALAAGGGMSEAGFESILILLGVVTVAYLVTHLISDWLQKRYGFVTGVEYIVIGVVVGPGFGLIDASMLTQFGPAIVLGTGSLGLLTGLQLNLKRLMRQRPPALGAGVSISLTTLIFVFGAPLAAGAYLLEPSELLHYLPHALAFGAVALAADQALIRTLVAFLHARGSGVNYLLRVARISSSLAVLVFGIIFCLDRVGENIFGWNLVAWESALFWFTAHIVTGLVLGLLFAAFLVRDFEDEKILTVVIGMVIFTSGFAYYLQLSPVFVNFMLGFVLANLSPQSEHVEAMLLSIEKPLYILLFLFAGTLMSFDVPWWAWGLFVVYIALRLSGRALGGVVANRLSKGAREYSAMGLSLVAPGGLSVAMALDYRKVHHDETALIVYTTMVLGILASEVIAYRFTRRWLIDSTDVSPEYAEDEEAAE